MTSALICTLLIGPVLLSAFLVVQIGQEGRAAVVHVREALPVWSMDNVTDASNGTLGAPGFVQEFLNQEWVRDYRVQVSCCCCCCCLNNVQPDLFFILYHFKFIITCFKNIFGCCCLARPPLDGACCCIVAALNCALLWHPTKTSSLSCVMLLVKARAFLK